MKYRLRSLLIFATLMPPLLAGVVLLVRSAASGPAILLVPVQGVVRLNGAPCDRVEVILYFDDGASAKGVTDKFGAFEMSYHGQKGCPPGKARVLVKRIPNKVPPDTVFAFPGKPPPSARYEDWEQTPLSVDVLNDKVNRLVVDLADR